MSAPTKVVEARKRRKLGASGVLAASQGKPLESRQLQSRKLTNNIGNNYKCNFSFPFSFSFNFGTHRLYWEVVLFYIYACSPVCLPIYIQEGERGEAVKRGSCFLLHSPASPRKSSSPLHQRRENFVQMLLLLRSIRIHSGYKNGSQLMWWRYLLSSSLKLETLTKKKNGNKWRVFPKRERVKQRASRYTNWAAHNTHDWRLPNGNLNEQ